jgi:hypothetical protein
VLFSQLLAQIAQQSRDQPVMQESGARHGKHLTLEVLAPVIGFALDLQVLLGREKRFRLGGHSFL